MKILLSIYVEPGDTAKSIAAEMQKQFGGAFDEQLLWSFNRNFMPTPQSPLPPQGSILRCPVNSAAVSGGPMESELRAAHLTAAELASASTVLGGVKTPNTEGGEVGAENPTRQGSKKASAKP